MEQVRAHERRIAAAISGIQSKVVAEAASDADKATLQNVADERVAVLALNKQARDLKTASGR